MELIDESGRIRGYAKVGWNSLTADLVRREEAALRVVDGQRLAHLDIPGVIDAGTWHGMTYLLLEPVDTRPTSRPDADARNGAMLELSSAFAESPVLLAASTYWATLRSSLDGLPGIGGRIESAARQLDAVADQITITPSAWHGDWTPWNMTTHGRTVTVWDWERFELGVPAGFDILHYAFHHAVRRDGHTPQRAIRRTAARATPLLAPFGVGPHDAHAIVALYLLHLGHRHLHDRQEEAGAKKGPLVTWLVPEVESLVDSVIRAHDRPEQDRPA